MKLLNQLPEISIIFKLSKRTTLDFTMALFSAALIIGHSRVSATEAPWLQIIEHPVAGVPHTTLAFTSNDELSYHNPTRFKAPVFRASSNYTPIASNGERSKVAR
ncbi:MAG: hypothetical protein QNL33_17835 [Akkermansiaceae bacterium]